MEVKTRQAAVDPRVAAWNGAGRLTEKAASLIPSPDVGLPNLAALLLQGDSRERVQAAEALRVIGPKAADAMPVLLRALIQDDVLAVRWRAAEALRKVHLPDAATPFLLKAMLRDASRSVRWRAAEALADAVARSEHVVVGLVRACCDEDHWVRWHAEEVLRRKGGGMSLLSVLRQLVGAEHESPMVRAFASSFLGEVSKGDPDSVIVLCQALRDESPLVRQAAAGTLGGMQSQVKEVEECLVGSLDDRDASVRAAAAASLGRIRRTSRAAAGALLRALDDTSSDVRGHAAASLGGIRTQSPDTRVALEGRLADCDSIVRRRAAIALADVGASTDRGITVLIEGLTDPQWRLQCWDALSKAISRAKFNVSEHFANAEPALSKTLAEVVARGVLPTIGIRLWLPGAEIRFPSKDGGDHPAPLPHPWEDCGVYHNWESHLEHAGVRTGGGIQQVCLHADWFAGIHLVAAVLFVLSPPSEADPEIPPSRVEEKETGFVVQGGGKLRKLEGMRALPSGARANRVDFLYASDLKPLQYLVFAALAARVPRRGRRAQEEVGAAVWHAFVHSSVELLGRYDLSDFARQEWYADEGWWSSRYGIRWERPYSEVRTGIIRLFRLLGSRQGDALRVEFRDLVDAFVLKLDSTLWLEGLKRLPASVRGFILRTSTCEKIRAHADASLRIS